MWQMASENFLCFMRKKLWQLLAAASLQALVPFMAQAQLYPVAFEEKVAEASLIVEGVVTGQRSYWNSQRTMIFTASTVTVSKVFKGSVPAGTIDIVTVGGSVGTESVTTDHLLSLSTTQKGVFFLRPHSLRHTAASGAPAYEVYAAEQGALMYQVGADRVEAPFEEYKGITTTFYQKLQAACKRNYALISTAVDVQAEQQTLRLKPRVLAPGIISSFSPSVVRAGALTNVDSNVLVISGSGFGDGVFSGGSVLFRDGNVSNNNPSFVVPASSDLIVSWTPNEIRVRVPSRASTGFFSVVSSPGDTALSPTPLQVEFAVLTATFGSGIGTKESRLVNRNFSGGYDLHVSNSTAGRGGNLPDSAIYGGVLRSIDTWRRTSRVNLNLVANTATQAVTGTDGENVIMLDNDNTGVGVLPSGVLGVCYSYNSICLGDPNFPAQKTGFDVVLRNLGVSVGSVLFENGPCAPPFVNPGRIDMETVILHELGHGINLAHINDGAQVPAAPNNFANFVNPAGLMHFAVSNFQARRSPERSALQGSIYAATSRGLALGFCGLAPGEMIASGTSLIPANDNCPASFPATPTPEGTVFDVDLRYATANKSVDPQFTAQGPVSGSPAGTDVTNNVYFAIRTSASGSLSLAVSGYNTLPGEVAAICATQGVNVMLFQANSCPTGQAFPTPVFFQRITGNGPLNTITGLAANQTYLLYFDGFRNTRARFNVTLTGAALPIVLAGLEGQVLPNGQHLLTADIRSDDNVQAIWVERSADAINFSSIGQLPAVGGRWVGVRRFTDALPLAGNNFYRLKVVDRDGSVQLSKVVKLTQSGAAALRVEPNPFARQLWVRGLPATAGTAELQLTDAAGRQVYRTRLASGGNSQQVQLPSLPKGLYLIQLVDNRGQVLLSDKLIRE